MDTGDTLDTLPGDAGQASDDRLPQELNDYRIIELIGRGSMGRVYRAVDQTLHREVALKLITRPDKEANHDRLLREARAAARLQHPGIASIYTAGIADGVPYLVEEYVRGSSLAALGKPVPWQRALELGRGLAGALMAAHRRGVLHRDIKPANIIVARDGTPKLVDFGLARLVGDGDGKGESEHPHHTGGKNGTSDSDIVGTPYYIAPEVWRGERASARADVYGLGVVLYELCAGHVPFHDTPVGTLGRVVAARDATPLLRVGAGVNERFAGIVDRCLARDPDRRFADGGALWDELEALHEAGRALSLPPGNPYRGLLPFESEHSGIFFGRDADIRRIIERLRSERTVLIAGESGVGKSSLLRAGVLPRIAMNGLGDDRLWETHSLVPGRRPLAELGDTLGRVVHRPGTELTDLLMHDAATLSRMVRRRHGSAAGTVLFVDQLEELVTLSDPDEAAAVSEGLMRLAERTPGLRVVAAVRGDKLTSLVQLPGLGAAMERSLTLLLPLGDHAIRQTVVGPARIKGVRFESDAMVDTLVRSTGPGGLPLLQFALAQLWERRDGTRAVISVQALEDIGGVAGALSQHADEVMDGLLPGTRATARGLLLQLVSDDGTRKLRTAAELRGPAEEIRVALDALIGGRLVVAREVDGAPVYELAHEALATGWKTLRRWLGEEGGERAVKERLADDAAEWERRGRPRDMLWPGSRLRDAYYLDAGDLPVPARDLLRESRRMAARRRQLRYGAMVLLFVVAGGFYPVLHSWQVRQAAQQVAEDVARHLEDAEPHRQRARVLLDEFLQARKQAFAHFRANEMDAGTVDWKRALDLAPEVEAAYGQARLALELGSRRAPDRGDVRALLAEVLHGQALLAAVQGRDEERERLLAQLAIDDDARAWLSLWTRPIEVSLTVQPGSQPGRSVTVAVGHYRRGRDGGYTLEEADVPISTPITGESKASWKLQPGSYLFVVTLREGGETIEVRYPVKVDPQAMSDKPAVDLQLALPSPDDVPRDFVYVPGGWFVYGYGTEQVVEPVREWYQTMPLHERSSEAYLIARHETTYAEWLEFVADQPGDPAGYLPRVEHDALTGAYVEVRALKSGYEWRFRSTKDAPLYTGTSEEPSIGYQGRDRNRTQSWLRMPVVGISPRVVEMYTTWLDRTGRVPGARLCREDEWERAARGADGRLYAHGDRLQPGDANFDLTYGQNTAGFGFDEVDAHPRSQSSFGLYGTVGNARELAVSIRKRNGYVLRGGSYFFSASTGATPNREDFESDQSLSYVGFRVCADWRAHH